MADKTVGQVSVRVVPDTDHFRDDAKAKLAKEEARLPELTVDLNIVFDDKSVVAKVRAVNDAAQRAVQDVSIGFNLDGVSAVRAAIETAATGAVAHIDVDIDKASLAGVKVALAGLRGTIESPLRMDVEAGDLKGIRERLEKELGRPVHVGVDPAFGDQLRQLAEAAGLSVQLKPEDADALSGQLKDLIERAGRDARIAPSIDIDESMIEGVIADFKKLKDRVKAGEPILIKGNVDHDSFAEIADAFAKLEEVRYVNVRTAFEPVGGKVGQNILDFFDSLVADDGPLRVPFTIDSSASSLKAQQSKLVTAWKQLMDAAHSDALELNAAIDVNSAVAQLHGEAFKVNLDFDKAAWHKKVAEARAEAEAQLTKNTFLLNLRADPKSVNAAIDELKALILKRGDLETRVKAELDGTAAAKLEIELAALNKKIGDTKLRITPEISTVDKVKFAAAMAILTRARTVTIDVALSKGAKAGLAGLGVASVLSGFDALKDSIVNAHEAFGELFTEMPKMMAVVPSVLALSGAFLSAGANIAGLVGNLAQALPILLAIPGIAIGIGITAVAFKDFGKELPGVVSQFKALQPLISANFWGAASGPIQNLANTVFPQLTAGVAGTAKALGGFFGGLADSISKVLGGGALTEWFTQLTASIQTFTGFTPALAGIFKLFGDVGSQMLQPLALLVGDLITRFQTWFQGLVDAAGGVNAFAQKTIAAFQGIVEFVLSIGNVFGGIFTAAAASGAATFQTLADHLNTFATFIKDPAFQAALTGLFGAAFTMMETFLAAAGPALQTVFGSLTTILTTALPQIGVVLAQLATVIGTIFSDPAVTAGLQAFISGILAGVSAIIPLIAPLGAIIAALGPILGQLAAQIGTVFAALSPSIGELVTAIGPLITIFGSALAAALRTLAPLITVVIGAFGSILTALTPMLEPLINALLIIVNAIVPPLMALIPALVPPLMAIVNAILPPLAGILLVLAPILAQIIGVVAAALVPILQILAPIIAQLAGFLGQLLAAFMPIIDVILQLVVALLPPLITIIQVVLDAAMIPLTFIIQGLVVVLKILGDILTWVVQQVIIPFVIPYITFLVNLIADTLIPIVKSIGEVFKAVWDFVMGVWAAFKKLFSGDVGGFIIAIKANFDEFAGKLLSIIGNAFLGILAKTGEAMIAIGKAIGAGIGVAVDWFKGLPAKIMAALGNLAALLVDAGVRLIQGLIDGIESMIQKVKDKLTSLTDLLPDWKGPASKDKTLLYDAGQLVIRGFLDGLESQYDAVHKSLKGFSSDVAGTAFAAPATGVSPGAFNGPAATGGSGNTFNYYAAPGSSLGAEEDLFSALGRGRAFGGW